MFMQFFVLRKNLWLASFWYIRQILSLHWSYQMHLIWVLLSQFHVSCFAWKGNTLSPISYKIGYLLCQARRDRFPVALQVISYTSSWTFRSKGTCKLIITGFSNDENATVIATSSCIVHFLVVVNLFNGTRDLIGQSILKHRKFIRVSGLIIELKCGFWRKKNMTYPLMMTIHVAIVHWPGNLKFRSYFGTDFIEMKKIGIGSTEVRTIVTHLFSSVTHRVIYIFFKFRS